MKEEPIMEESPTKKLSPVVDSAINLGLVWAKYGISIAKVALKTQSASFQLLSNLLSQVADALPTEKDAKATKAEEPS